MSKDVLDPHVPSTLLKPMPGLVLAIITVVIGVLKQNPQANRLEILYLSVKQSLKSTKCDSRKTSFDHLVFVYYLEVYRALSISKKADFKEFNTGHDPLHLSVYNDAALSLFDLYLLYPQDFLVRKLLPMATEALQEVITIHQSCDTNKSIPEAMGDLATIAVLTQTVGDFTKGPLKRPKNYPYITWLRDTLKQCISSPDLFMIKDEPVFKDIVAQIMNKKQVISINTINE